MLGNPNGIDDDESLFTLGVGRDALEIGVVDGSCATSLHLLEVRTRPDVAHEENALDGFDVGAGRNHVHSDHDAQVRRVSELLEQRLGIFGVVRNFGGEVVTLAEDFSGHQHNLFGVIVVLGEDERLRNYGTTRKDFAVEPVTKRFEDETNLGLAGNRTIQFTSRVIKVLVEGFPTLLSRSSVHLWNDGARLDGRTLLRNLGLDTIDLEVDVDAIGD